MSRKQSTQKVPRVLSKKQVKRKIKTMEKYIGASYSLTVRQVKKLALLAQEKDEISASKYLRKLLDKLPEPKTKY